MLWQDLQEIFYITMGNFFYYLLLPVFVAGGLFVIFKQFFANLFGVNR